MCALIATALLGLGLGVVADDRRPLSIRVQAVVVSDDDGRRAGRTTPEQMAEWVAFANRAFVDARIRFEFDPRADYTTLRSTLANGMTGVQDRNWNEAREFADAIAARFPGRLVCFSRYGPGEHPTGGAFSWWDYNFVVMGGYADMSHCGHPHVDAFAHEVGHYLGLVHTFAADPFPDQARAEAFFRERESNPGAFDGDGLSDTLPDPAIRSLECPRVEEITLGGVSFQLPRRNLMSYYDERNSLSPQQIARARWMLAKRLEGGGALPSNRGARQPVELEALQVEEGATGRQEMGAFGAHRWSGGAHLFWGARQGDALTLCLPVAKPGRYQVALYGTLAPDFGVFRVTLDGRPLGKPVDAYAPVVLATGRIPLGTLDLAAGTHRLRFEMAGKNPASTDCKLGIDCLELVPAR